jgi:hydroxymethylpyrimidine/phosphomethylpyrimidine kinase
VSTVLLIGGTDSSGGAGLTRDVSTLTSLGAQALCAVTAVTAQSDAALIALQLVPSALVSAQIAAALATRPVKAVKIGMLGTEATVHAVAASLPGRDTVPLVLDPVLVSSSGAILLDAAGRSALRERLLPRTTVLTPNIPEAAALLGRSAALTDEELLEQCRALLALGPQAVLLKGGHATGALSRDLLLEAGDPPRWFSAPRQQGSRRGTGCAFAAALAAGLAAGVRLADACERAKHHVAERWQQGGW